MFTGIVTDVGTVRSATEGAERRFEIATRFPTAEIALGASIACAGICLTVTATGPDWFAVYASAETIARTTAGAWRPGSRLNLERALRMGDELGGHLVTGHVDGLATLTGRSAEGEALRLAFAVPPNLAPLIATKGSVTVDGVSLTVNATDDAGFGVAIIPHTREATTLGALEPGDRANLEIDLLARYVARLLGRTP